jgi:hypothetical protein
VLIKHDPGEYVTLLGMITVILGAVLMCLVRGKKDSPAGDFDSPDSASVSSPDHTPVSKSSASSRQNSSKKNKGGKK